LVTADVHTWKRNQFPSVKKDWISAALEDAAARAARVWESPTTLEVQLPHTESLLRWAKSMNLQQVVALRPEVGPLHDSLPMMRDAFAREGIRLVLLERAEDLRIRPFATGGFFPFWERLRKNLAASTPS
jgi:hypothetical protein